MNQKTASAPAAENKMGTMPIGRLLFNMSLPMMVSMLVQALYNIVDSIFVAKLSENALTAVSLAFPLQMLLIAVATGTGVGMNALLSRALGAKKTDEANKIASNAAFLYIISYIVFLILGFTVVKPFYASQIGNADVEIMEMGIDYPKIIDETFYTKTFSQNKILGQALIKSELYLDGDVIFTWISLDEMRKYDVLPKHLDGIVNQLRITKDIKIAVFLYENEDGTYKGSLRVNGDYDVSAIASIFGGGGHVKAAGFTIDGPVDIARDRIIGAIKENIRGNG